MEELWHSKLPLKIENFVWLALRNKVQAVDNLGRKKWKGGKLCQLCQVEETKDHLFFQCPSAVLCGQLYGIVCGGELYQRVFGTLMKTSFQVAGVGVWVLYGFCSVLYARRCGLVEMFFHLISLMQHWMATSVGGHKMHIFTANIPAFHSRYRRYVLNTNEFHKFC
jgi:hypothetical protein